MERSDQKPKEKRKLGGELVVFVAVLAALAVSVITVTMNAAEVGGLFGHGKFSGSSEYGSSSWYGDPNYTEVTISVLAMALKGSLQTINSNYKYVQLKTWGYVISRGEGELLLGCYTGFGDEMEEVIIARAISISGLVGEVGDRVEVRGICMGVGTGDQQGLLIMDRCLMEKLD